MTELLLVRHAETDWNASGRFQGHADPPLNERGRQQAHALAVELAGTRFDALYASPLRRAAETAEVLGAALQLPVTLVEDLREVDVGEWQGLTRAEVEARYPDALASWLAFGPGWERGETYEVLGDRVLTALRTIAAAHAGGRVLAVSHGGPLRAALAAAAGLPHAASRSEIRPVANCAVVRLHLDGAELRRLD